MLTAAFDIGGVLRRVALPKTNVTRFDALRELYKTLAAAPAWRVVVVTRKPGEVDEATTRAELNQLGLPPPDALVVLHGGSKAPAYKQWGVDIVFDDEDDCIADALSQNAAGAQIR